MRRKNRIFWALGAAAALLAGYWLCGHVFLFLHGMGQWPIILLLFGLIVIGIAAIADSRKVLFCTVCGYVVGFALGMLFHWDTYHPERGPGVYTNNNWLIWTLVFFFFIAAGAIWEIACKHKRKKSTSH
jgi:hypothetical protein